MSYNELQWYVSLNNTIVTTNQRTLKYPTCEQDNIKDDQIFHTVVDDVLFQDTEPHLEVFANTDQ